MKEIKTFEDACASLLIDVNQFNLDNVGRDIDSIAYEKLKIIAKALNNGWEPPIGESGYVYTPWFIMYTPGEVDEMFPSERKGLVFFGGSAANGYCALRFCSATSSPTGANTNIAGGFRVALRNRELATYSGEKFIDVWCEFLTGQKVL